MAQCHDAGIIHQALKFPTNLQQSDGRRAIGPIIDLMAPVPLQRFGQGGPRDIAGADKRTALQLILRGSVDKEVGLHMKARIAGALIDPHLCAAFGKLHQFTQGDGLGHIQIIRGDDADDGTALLGIFQRRDEEP